MLFSLMSCVYNERGICRFSWQTVTRIFDDRCMGMKFDADEKAGAGQSSLLAFGPGGSHQRHSFFRSRQIQHAAVDVWA